MLFSSPFVYWNPLNKNSERLKARVLHRNEETALRVVLFFLWPTGRFSSQRAHTFIGQKPPLSLFKGKSKFLTIKKMILPQRLPIANQSVFLGEKPKPKDAMKTPRKKIKQLWRHSQPSEERKKVKKNCFFLPLRSFSN
jgi:hypothetical protein